MRNVLTFLFLAALTVSIGATDVPPGMHVSISAIDDLPAPALAFQHTQAVSNSATPGVDHRLRIERVMDERTPALLQMAHAGTAIDEVILVVRQAAGSGDTLLYQVTLADARLTSHTLEQSTEVMPRTSLELTYKRIAWHVVDPLESTPDIASFGWDLESDLPWKDPAAPNAPIRRILLHVTPPPDQPVEVLLRRLGELDGRTGTLDQSGSVQFDDIPGTRSHILELLALPMDAG